MAEVPPLQVLRELNGYTVTEGETRPNVRPRRFVAVNPAQLGEIIRKWAEKGEALEPFNPDADVTPALPTIQGDAFRFPAAPVVKPT
jgi:hypothetical protein